MNRKTTILIIDDDPDLREELVDQLNGQDDLRAHGVGVGHEGMAAALDGKAGLILLDVSLPDGDGRALCRDMRDAGVRTPIVMLTGEADDHVTIDALEAGANDYVTKPFKFNVLLARIRAHLRSHESSEDAVFRIGPYDFHPAAKTLSDGAHRVRLTEKETSILKYLYRAGAKPVPREELLREVWGYNSGVTTHTLETHIYRLRQKIEPEATSPQLLITETGGYRLAP